MAKNSRYCAAKLARDCGVSRRQLERYSQLRFQAAPHQWLRVLRLRRAVELITKQTPIKEVAIELGYKDAAHFAHDFKDYIGVCPSCFAQNLSSPVSPGPNVAV